MINLIKADFYKINRSAIYRVLFIISAICAITTTVVSHNVYSGNMDTATAASTAMLTDVVILNLINCVLAGQLICGDFENKLIQSALTGTSGRFTLVCSKMAVYTALIGIMSVPYALCAIICPALCSGYCAPFSASAYLKMLFDSTTADFSMNMILKYTAISVIMVLVYAAQSGFVFLMGFIIKNKPLIVTALGFVINTIIGMGSSLIAGNSAADKVLEWTPYGLDIYSMGNDTGTFTLIKVSLICIVFIALFTGLSYAAFRNAEIK